MQFCSFPLVFSTSIALLFVAPLLFNDHNFAIAQSSFEVEQLYQQGQEQYRSGQFQTAIRIWQQAITLYRQSGNRLQEGYALVNIGFAYSNIGNYNLAAEFHLQGVTIAREISNADLEALGLYGLGGAYDGQGNYPQAIAVYQQSLMIARKVNYRRTEAQVLRALAESYQAQAKYTEAIEFYQQSLKLAEEIDPREQGRIFSSLGALYRQLGNYSDAIDAYWKSIDIARRIPDRAGEGSSLLGLGNAYAAIGDRNHASQYWRQSLVIAQEIGDGTLESIVSRALQSATPEDLIVRARETGDRDLEAYGWESQGVDFHNRGNYSQALEAFQQSLSICRELGKREEEAEILSYIGQTLIAQNKMELAIVFLKQSVNVTETIRQENLSLSQELQQSYTETVADTYRRLADLLLSQGRILESQQVLELLKLQELREFTGVRAKVTTSGIELTPVEQEIVTQYDGLIAFGQQVNQCQKEKCTQLTALLNQRDQLTQQFNQTLQTFEAQIRARLSQDRAALDTQDFNRSAREIVEAQPGTVMIYAVVLDDKLWLLWATAGGIVNSVEVPVTQQKLGETVLQFRQLLSTPTSDINQVQATAKQLYDWLIAPIAPELQKNHIQHLVFSLDRVTRYIPMAALFDGQHYLLENYTVSTVLSADLTRVSDRLPPGTDKTSVLALGLSDAVPPDFPGLPNVPAELNAIVRSANDPQGIYPGLKFLNQQFDDHTLRDNVLGHQIVHIATHGVFVSGRQDQSYLVLGNGNHMSISSIQDLQDLGGVRLVVLSACQTALGEPDQDGIEIAGIAYYFLNGGVNTVMASLWSVNDVSTQQLMQHLYRNLSQSTAQAPITRAEALRKAQLSLLQGETNGVGSAGRSIVRVTPRPGISPATPTSPGLSHPYYWAPFILIGNGS